MFVNPSYQFDPTVDLVVVKFRDGAGKMTHSIPSQKQLAAYRTQQASRSRGQVADAPKAPPSVAMSASSRATGDSAGAHGNGS
jgi:hypothetical protein